jgi:hypothetical protein
MLFFFLYIYNLPGLFNTCLLFRVHIEIYSKEIMYVLFFFINIYTIILNCKAIATKTYYNFNFVYLHKKYILCIYKRINKILKFLIELWMLCFMLLLFFFLCIFQLVLLYIFMGYFKFYTEGISNWNEK